MSRARRPLRSLWPLALRPMPYTPPLPPGWKPRTLWALLVGYRWTGLLALLSAITALGRLVSRALGLQA